MPFFVGPRDEVFDPQSGLGINRIDHKEAQPISDVESVAKKRDTDELMRRTTGAVVMGDYVSARASMAVLRDLHVSQRTTGPMYVPEGWE